MSGSEERKCAVVLLAAGSGQRLGHGVPKARVPLAGVTLLEHAVRGVLRTGLAAQLCIAIPADDEPLRHLAESLGREAAAAGVGSYHVVDGGADRADSVRAALAVLDPELPQVLIHDAARPLAPVGVFDRVVTALRHGALAVIPALAVVDTIKTVTVTELAGGGLEKVSGTPPRHQLRAVQTPQGFDAATLRRAHESAATLEAAAAAVVTDDAMLVEHLGEDVFVVQGSTYSLKITTPTDLLLAGAMLEGPLRPRWIEG